MAIESVEAARAAGIPVIECQRLPRKPHWACDLFVVSECPFCGERHTHGAGEGDRSAHCALPGPGETYYLIEGASRK